MSPKISVLLSVYNGEKYLQQAIDSILGQTFADFELIVINDGSTDATAQIIGRCTDPRIVAVTNEQNIGLVKSLNKGLRMARGEYVARMDADDMSVSDRFEKQVRFLEQHPDIGVLGTAMQQTDKSGRVLSTLRMPAEHGLILWTMFFDLAVIHASVMMRKKVVMEEGGYNEDFIHCEDTELWSRLIFTTRFANLSEPLYIRRLHSGSIMSAHSAFQNRRTLDIKERLFNRALGYPVPRELIVWFSDSSLTLTPEQKRSALEILNSLSHVCLRGAAISEEVKQQIKKDLERRMLLIQRADKHRFLKFCLRLLKMSLPPALRHKLRVSVLGSRIERKLH